MQKSLEIHTTPLHVYTLVNEIVAYISHELLRLGESNMNHNDLNVRVEKIFTEAGSIAGYSLDLLPEVQKQVRATLYEKYNTLDITDLKNAHIDFATIQAMGEVREQNEEKK